MQDNRASFTARLVALFRAIAITRDEAGERRNLDPTAPTMLGDPATAVLAKLSLQSPAAAATMRVASLGFVDQMLARTTAIDGMLALAAGEGTRQVVILGAGLDGRAWRLDALRDCRVFEVDHPATQATKTARVAGLAQVAADLTFVSVDFERDRLVDRLAEAGHDPEQPTAWVWEGVTMYLQPQTTDATLADLARLSAPASRLAVTYAPADTWAMRTGPLRDVALRVFELWGEPLVGMATPEDFARRVTDAGWTVEDTNAIRGYPSVVRVENLLVARRGN